MSAAVIRVDRAIPVVEGTEAPRINPAAAARATYQELRRSGLSDLDIMAFAGEVLDLVATDVSRESRST
jgi:hypothetical protein